MIAILRALSWLCARLSLAQVQRAGRVLGWLLGSLLRYRRGEVLSTIQRCFPEKTLAETRAVADGMYRHLGTLLIEALRSGRLSPAALAAEVDFSDLDKAMRLLEEGRGLLVLTAHVGNFELLAMLAAFKGAPLSVLVKELKPKWLNAWWVATRAKFGVKMLPARNSYRACREVLKANGILGFILDQNMKRNRGIFVDYFGAAACTSPGLALLSAQCGAPVLPAFMLRGSDGRHRLHVLDPLKPPAGTDQEAIRQATQAYTTIIEQFVRAHPEQWIWLHRRWRTQPLPAT
ncbi:MAG: lysophospholipid acyltransferase family protein [Lentisphaerae bacterium]|nr:lysophospholipid acyltransferase family protein [Lentisphaerota bacterium]